MKYCMYCGRELLDEAVICPGCGCEVGMKKQKSFKSYSIGVKILIIVFLVIAMVTSVLASMLYGGAYIFALVWEIPMFILIIKKLKNNEKISTALKVCTFIFFSIVSGIVLLTMDN